MITKSQYDKLIERKGHLEQKSQAIKMELNDIRNTVREYEINQAMLRKIANEQRQKRKEILIQEWWDRDMKPGIFVRVNASSATRIRKVVSKRECDFSGMHYFLDKDFNLEMGKYITVHIMKNIMGAYIVENGTPRYVNISTLCDMENPTYFKDSLDG